MKLKNEPRSHEEEGFTAEAQRAQRREKKINGLRFRGSASKRR
jgi:hypothetical protein